MNKLINPKTIIIGGPTASGKTGLALQVSKYYDSELINADSRQVYKYFNIGTNKGDIQRIPEQKRISGFLIPKVLIEDRVEGWLFDFLEPTADFNLNDYQILANEISTDIQIRGKFPVIVGGTGLYIDALINGYELNTPPDTKLREELNNLSVEELQSKLESTDFDLENLNNSDRNNPVRLIRLIEKSTNKPKSLNADQLTSLKANKLISQEAKILLYPEFDREDLMTKINERVQAMFDQGLVEEVEELLNKGHKDTKPMQGIGYKETVRYLDGEIDKKKCIELIQIAHRQYAKRQITWFESPGRGYNLVKVNKDSVIPTLKNFLQK